MRLLTQALRAQQHEFANRLHTVHGLPRTAGVDDASEYLAARIDAPEPGRVGLRAYARFGRLLASRAGEVSQQGVDRAIQALHQVARSPMSKGQSPVTARLAELRRTAEPLTAADVAERLGIARGTAQRYLAGLGDEGRVQMSLRYGSSGRPEH